MEGERGGEDGLHQWFNAAAVTNTNNHPALIPSYSRGDAALLPAEYHQQNRPAAAAAATYWDPTSGNLVFQDPMLQNHLFHQNPSASSSQTNANYDHHFLAAGNNNLQNGRNSQCISTDFAGDQSPLQNQNQLVSAFNRLNIANNIPSHQEFQTNSEAVALASGPTSNRRPNNFIPNSAILGNNGFTQYPSSTNQEEDYSYERLKNQYILLMAQMDQYMRLHGGTNNQSINALPRSNSSVSANNYGDPKTWSAANFVPNRSATTARPTEFGFGYPLRPSSSSSSLRNGLSNSSSRGSSTRYAANGSMRQRLSHSSSMDERAQQVNMPAALGAKDSRFANGSARQLQLSAYSVSLEEVRGQVALVAKDHGGCRLLQKKIEEGKPEEIQMIFSEVMEADFRDLMVDQFGTEFFQKLVEATNREGLTKMLEMVMSDEKKLKDICVDQNGSRAMQKLLERVETREQQSSFMRLLKRITIPLSKTQPGFYVIQVCLKHFAPECSKGVADLVVDNCLSLAKDKFGCCLLQTSVQHAYAEAKEHLVADITEHARVLADDPYGNYVVQYIIGLKIPRVTADILAQLGGSFVNLSMNKYGSNVVEKSLKEAGEEHVNRIVNEIISSPQFVTLLQDPYGNYVAQSALGVSKGAVHNALVQLIRSNYPYLHSHLYGKRVLDKTRGSRHRA